MKLDPKGLEAAKEAWNAAHTVYGGLDAAITAYLAAAADSPALKTSDEAVWQHKKRGYRYTVVAISKIQSETPLADMDEVVIYRDIDKGVYWVRRKSEFFDGRFERVDDIKPSDETRRLAIAAGVEIARQVGWQDAEAIATAAIAAYEAAAAPSDGKAAAAEPGEGKWCQPMDQGKHTPRKFIVRFEDPELGYAAFDDEAEARAFWERANTNWNCYLFGALSLHQAPPSTKEE